MTTKEKLEKALEALKYIANGRCEIVGSAAMYAANVHANLTTPRTEPVEVKRWLVKYGSKEECLDHQPDFDESAGCEIIELTGTYQRPIPEPETWKGEVDPDHHWDTFIRGVPREWIGKKVIVEVCE